MGETLVRDTILEWQKETGDQRQVTVAAPCEKLKLLTAKLIEEAKEVDESPSLEELGDCFTVIKYVGEHLGFCIEDIWQQSNKKEEDRGGFRKGYVLHGREGK